MSYRIFTDATADLTQEQLRGIFRVEIIPMEVRINDQVYEYGPYGNLPVPVFYNLQRQGHFASTSQINPETYIRYFEIALKNGEDVLYLGFSSGMSGCMQSVNIAAETLREEYPDRKILCVDTLCASVGEGLLVLEAARKQAAGMSIGELAQWVTDTRLNLCHWFTVDAFEHLKHGGRVSAATAAVGTMLNIKPMLHVDDAGKLEVTEKPRGQKKAMAAQLRRLADGWAPELSQQIFIGHGDDLKRAMQLRDLVQENFPSANIIVGPIGPVIGSHTGPGMLALTYFGNNR